ncbi:MULTISPECIES: PEP-CTERM sorting domain-containing protein [unclassified Roseateles]|uniref:PEP-CTERM sorting domain-containing protein n=1 Tax=unclassified Roseateles TaxID=2626991 RepID=UPI0006F45808|nr:MULTISPECIES: PEP-CTERM sorting domain-containing protein [unclassified Roseateles]KQW46226.1 hypothetical protein ASC81_07350 [Pelomonas sp. Root405]KRA73275.1 hypothetical protein ASD88_07350 [Pelomonas sp. Root662]
MRSIPSIRAAALLSTVAVCVSAHADISSSFAAGLEGWTGQGGTVTHIAGGYLRQQDTQATWMSVTAPAGYLGDLSAYLGGTVSFDAINLNGVAADLISGPVFGTVTISGAGGSASRVLTGAGTGQPAPGAGWTHFEAPLDAADWNGNLAGALAGVTSLTVTLESNNDIVEINGFDNFSLIAVVPEPSTWALSGAGLALLGALARRRASRASTPAIQ